MTTKEAQSCKKFTGGHGWLKDSSKDTPSVVTPIGKELQLNAPVVSDKSVTPEHTVNWFSRLLMHTFQAAFFVTDQSLNTQKQQPQWLIQTWWWVCCWQTFQLRQRARACSTNHTAHSKAHSPRSDCDMHGLASQFVCPLCFWPSQLFDCTGGLSLPSLPCGRGKSLPQECQNSTLLGTVAWKSATAPVNIAASKGCPIPKEKSALLTFPCQMAGLHWQGPQSAARGGAPLGRPQVGCLVWTLVLMLALWQLVT